MTEKSKEENTKHNFKEIYANYSDDDLTDVLKKRKHYQKEAAKTAIREAIKRGIINSEQDLFSEEFRVEPLRFSILPTIENENARQKIRKSVARSLLIIGVLPVVWGAIRVFRADTFEGVILFILGSFWIYISIQLVKEVLTKWINLLYLLLGAAIIYTVSNFAEQKSLVFMDAIVAAILFGFILYGLLFIRKLK